MKEKGVDKEHLDVEENKKMKISDFLIYDCLSVGGFSKVFLVRSRNLGRFYAAKFVCKRRDDG